MLGKALKILTKLKKADHSAFFAGGCVRDFVMKLEPKDIDIATSAKPEEVEKLFKNTKPIGKEFGVILVIQDGEPFEVTTFRKDVGVKKGRWPESVEFSSEEEDAKRRDFTINGMFLSTDNFQLSTLNEIGSWKDFRKKVDWEVVDYVGGIDDIEDKIVRFIGDPKKRIDEDRLRILRAVRFKNELEFEYAKGVKQVLKDSAKLVKGLSDERIREELQKGLMCKNRRQFVEELSELGILEQVLPEIDELKKVKQGGKFHKEGDVFIHTMMMLDEINKLKNKKFDPLLPWIILFHDSGKKETAITKNGVPHWYGHEKVSAEKAKKSLKRLKFSCREVDDVGWVIVKGIAYNFNKMSLAKKRELFLDDRGRILLDYMTCDSLGKVPRATRQVGEFERAYKDAQKFKETLDQKYSKYLKGSFVMEVMGLKAGPKVGEAVEKLRMAILDERVKDEKEIVAYLRGIK